MKKIILASALCLIMISLLFVSVGCKTEEIKPGGPIDNLLPGPSEKQPIAETGEPSEETVPSEPSDEEPIEVSPERVIQEGIVPIDIILAGFEPKNISIAAGTTVVFTNTVKRAHVIHIYVTGGTDNIYETITQSQRMLINDSFNYTFNDPGVFKIRDLILNWRAEITVE